MMKYILVFLISLLFFSKAYSQEIIEIPAVTKKSKSSDPNFDNFRRFQNNLNTKNLDYINTDQAYSKTFIFIGDKKVFYQISYLSKKIKLINHTLKGSHFESVLQKETFSFEIKKEFLILKSLKNNTQLVLKIDRSGKYIKLIDERTKEIYIALEEQVNK
jgi:hypothetical protein